MHRLVALVLALGLSCQGRPVTEASRSVDPDTTGGGAPMLHAPARSPTLTVGVAHPADIPNARPSRPRERTPVVVVDAEVTDVETADVSLCCDVPSGLCYLMTPGAASCDAATSATVDCSTIAVRCIDKDLGIFVCAD